MDQDSQNGGPDSLPPAIYNQFSKAREDLIAKERSLRSDHAFRQSLSPTATKACTIVAKIRAEERSTIWASSSVQNSELFPGMMFNIAKTHMETTRLFQIVSKMPKGALLHCHLGAMVDLQWLFRTALEEECMCIAASEALVNDDVRERAVIRFGASKSASNDAPSIWSSDYVADTLVPVAVAADSFSGGRQAWVSWMQDRCSITQSESLQHHLGINDVWAKLNSAFITTNRVIYYEPIMRKFLREFFRTLQRDGVRWLEFRAAPLASFVLEGEEEGCGDPEKLLKVTVEEIESFMSSEEGKGFWGMRMIWVGMRWWDTENVVKDMKDCIRLKKLYPDLISGYDLVGHEDAGRTLKALTPELLWFQSECAAQKVNIPFFFHAGECLGDGDETDQNLFDAILFGTRRLGHGFSLYKHPTLIDEVKEKSILVESCPISNEVLRYTASIMSHPLPALLARGVPAALANDDPALLGQGTSGVTHDFWQALQGWENLGLAGLGSLAQNSVVWSAYEDETTEEWELSTKKGQDDTGIRARRIKQWNQEWEEFCEWIVKEFGDES